MVSKACFQKEVDIVHSVKNNDYSTLLKDSSYNILLIYDKKGRCTEVKDEWGMNLA
jgi:hypothetical protein